jgi:hypothetical protein
MEVRGPFVATATLSLPLLSINPNSPVVRAAAVPAPFKII